MQLSKRQFEMIEDCFPKPRGNIDLSSFHVINALLYVVENGCKWRRLPERYGNWHTIYTRVNRWSKRGVLAKVFEKMQRCQLVKIKVEAVSLDSTSIKVHPDGTGALKKTDRKLLGSPGEAGTPRFIWLPQIPAQR